MKFIKILVLAMLAALVLIGCTTSNTQNPLNVSVLDLNSNSSSYLDKVVKVEGTLTVDRIDGPFFIMEQGKSVEVTAFLPYSIARPPQDYNGQIGLEPSMAGWNRKEVSLVGIIKVKSIGSVEASYILDVNSYSLVE